MHIIKGNLWDEVGKADLILFTANSVIGAGGLVMGGGAAKEAKERYPFLPVKLGREINGRPRYGVVSVAMGDTMGNVRVGAFQVKYHWRDNADLELIKFSCNKLAQHTHKFKRIALNYPGIGLGKLTEAQVAPLLQVLPDNVFIYKL